MRCSSACLGTAPTSLRRWRATSFSDQLRSGLFQSLGLGADAERDRESDMKPLRGLNAPANFNSFTVSVQANYEFDLWIPAQMPLS